MKSPDRPVSTTSPVRPGADGATAQPLGPRGAASGGVQCAAAEHLATAEPSSKGLERVPLGTPYPVIVGHVARLLGKLPTATELAIDFTGVSRRSSTCSPRPGCPRPGC
jgi:hypothetical protein